MIVGENFVWKFEVDFSGVWGEFDRWWNLWYDWFGRLELYVLLVIVFILWFFG